MFFDDRLAFQFMIYRKGGLVARSRLFSFKNESTDLFLAYVWRVWRFEVFMSYLRRVHFDD